MKLSVIIVNYNVKYFLEQCLHSLRQAMKGIDGEVWVVDNASADGSRSYLEPLFPEVRFEWNEDNKGFARACNQALWQSAGEYVLFLNPDTILPEDSLSGCIRFMEEHADAGALGIRMLDGQGQFLPESKRAFPSPLTSFYKLSGLSSLFPRSATFARYHLGHLDEHRNHEIEVIAGAFMLVRRQVLDQCGGFDEDFFMYGEDVDLSYRIKQVPLPQGIGCYKNYYYSGHSIVHFKGESTRKGSLNYVRIFYQAMSRFVQKHYSGSSAGIYAGLIKVAIWMRALISIFKRFIQRAGLPLLDAVLIYVSFWLAKTFWTSWVKPGFIYPTQLLTIAFVGFTTLFLVVSYYTGLYEKRYQPASLWRSFVVALLVNLVVYSLLPEQFRFSRGIVLAGSFFSYASLAFWRTLLLRNGLIERDEPADDQYALVVGTQQCHQQLRLLLEPSGRAACLKGFVSPLPEVHSLGLPEQLPQLLDSTPAKELLLCAGDALPYSKVLQVYQQTGRRVKLRVHAAGSKSVVGSDSKNYAGEVIGVQQFQISWPVHQRLKRLADVVASLLLLLMMPLHLLLNRHPMVLLLHAWQVLLGQKIWVGYSGDATGLPSLQPSVLGPTGIPHRYNTLNTDGLWLANEWYAQNYQPLYDVLTLLRHYRQLGVR